jgi:hypothetical protein
LQGAGSSDDDDEWLVRRPQDALFGTVPFAAMGFSGVRTGPAGGGAAGVTCMAIQQAVG